MERVQSSLSDYVTFLPGTVTPQKYMGIDDCARVNVTIYGQFIEKTIDLFNRDWPLRQDGSLDPLVTKLMVVDGATMPMLSESLRLLTVALSESMDDRKTRAILTILQDLLKSDAIFSAIVDACQIRGEPAFMLEVELDQAWRSVTQILVSLPSRIANKMQLNTPKLYMPQVYIRLLCFHVCRAMHFINEAWHECNLEPKVTVLSTIISKILITSKPTYDLACFIDILKEWCYENIKNEKRLVRSVLRELDATAVEHLATLFLKRCEPKYGVRPVFGDVLTAPHWKYILLTKIPLMRYHTDDKLIFNLISYLSSCENGKVLLDLMMKLIDVWRDSSILNHTPVEQHEYVSRLIILSLRACESSLEDRNFKERCRQFLITGVSVHLECTDIYVRAMGMITAEICMKYVSEKDAPQLEFNYSDMPTRVQVLLESLKHLCAPTVVEYQHSDGLAVGDVETSANKMYELVADILPNSQALSSEKPEDNVSSTNGDLVQKEMHDVEVTSRTRDDVGKSCQSDDEKSELDSDDDLVPYDMDEEQVKPVSKVRPMYLRDLRDNLTDERTVSDPDIFSESMLVCEELIRTQLPNDDVSFAVELLELLVTLRQQSYIENFEIVVFRCCVEIVVVHPKECAEFLCKQFYEDASKYSLNQRLLFLDALSESAKRLSDIKVNIESDAKKTPKLIKKSKPTSSPVSIFIDTTKPRRTQELCYGEDMEDLLEAPESRVANWREVIDKRIESHTRRFAHQSKMSTKSVNRFANVVSSFVYPLLYGFNWQQGSVRLQSLRIYGHQENIVLLRYLKTLSVIMRAAENCPLALKIGKEILELTWTLRGHEEATVRFTVVECIASVLVSLPRDQVVIIELLDTLTEIQEWLLLTQNVIFGEHDVKCREMNATVLRYVGTIIGFALS